VRTISFKLLYGLVILRHARRRLVAITFTSNPTAEWIAGQLTDAFPWDEAPRHLTRDPRRGLRSSLHSSHSGNGDPLSFDCPALSVTERPRRALHRLHPARISRSPDSVRRGAIASGSEEFLPITTRSARTSHCRRMRQIFGARRTSACRSNTNSRRTSASIRPGSVCD
jgi:hypothetical protein